jgi:hypothetical protein
MTGAEVAGLVLGAIPLVISALEHYDDFAQPTKDFFHQKRYQRKLSQELYMIHISYDQAIRLLLKGIAETTSDREAMIDNPRSELWREGHIADSLRHQLGLVYKPFLLTIEEMAEMLAELLTNLNIIESQQGSQQV